MNNTKHIFNSLTENPFIITAILYLGVAALSALSSGISSLFDLTFFQFLAWPRIHFITIGGITQFTVGILPILLESGTGKNPKIRWDLWFLLNTGFMTFLAGRLLYHNALLITGGLLLFSALSIFLVQLFSIIDFKFLTPSKSGLFYITGVLLFLLGIIVGTGIWVGWSSYLQIKVALEVHIHANNWGLISFVFAGMAIDLLPKWVGSDIKWKFSFSTIYYLMVPGAIGLIAGPWIGSNWFAVPGLLLHLAASAMVIVNIVHVIATYEFDLKPMVGMWVSGYFWFFAPVFYAPLIVFKIGSFSSYNVEGFAPEALVYGWLLLSLLVFLRTLLSFSDHFSADRVFYTAIILIHIGAIFLWTSIFTAGDMFYGIAYIIWGIALSLGLFSVITGIISEDNVLSNISQSDLFSRLSMFFAFVAVGFYVLIITGISYSAESGPNSLIPILGGVGFLIGGLLISLKNKRLISIGLILNMAVFVFYFIGHLVQGDVFDAFAILTKVNQLLLEASLFLVYLSLE